MYKNETIMSYINALSSGDAVPGGGGASALVCALGMALGNMVGALTIGKRKYADVEPEIRMLMEEAGNLQKELLDDIARDAECFRPLAAAYSLPSETEEDKAFKDARMEESLNTACSVPLDIMRKAGRAIRLQSEFAEKGSLLAVSDAGTGVAMCKAALRGASLNVYINTGMMKDRDRAEKLDKEAEEILLKYSLMADHVFDIVLSKIRKD